MKKQILFVCTGNTCRSPLAELLAEQIFAEHGIDASFSSAGTAAIDGEPLSQHTCTVAAAQGLDATGRCSRALTPQMVAEADLVLTMAKHHLQAVRQLCPDEDLQGKLFTLADYAGGDPEQRAREVRDPFGQSLQAYVAMGADLQELLHRLAEVVSSI